MIGKKDGTPKDLELPSILKCSLVSLKKKTNNNKKNKNLSFHISHLRNAKIYNFLFCLPSSLWSTSEA